MLRGTSILLVGLGVLTLGVAPAVAVDIATGDILVADASMPAIVHVDPATGDRTIVSSSSVGTGTNFVLPTGITLEASGHILVSDLALQGLVRVDPVSGDRTVLSSPTVGSGPVILGPWGLTIGMDGQAYVTSVGAVIRVNPITGERTLVTSTDQTFKCLASGDPFACCTGFQAGNGTYPCATSVGSGPTLDELRGIDMEPSGDFLFVESTPQGSVSPMHRFSAFTGDRVSVAAFGDSPLGMVIESDGKVLAIDQLIGTIYRVDPSTGSSTQLFGTGPSLSNPRYIALNDSGDALVTDGGGAVFLVDATSGDRSIVSSSSVGTGPDFAFPQGIAVVGPTQLPVPALSTRGIIAFVLLVLAVLLMLRRYLHPSGPR